MTQGDAQRAESRVPAPLICRKRRYVLANRVMEFSLSGSTSVLQAVVGIGVFYLIQHSVGSARRRGRSVCVPWIGQLFGQDGDIGTAIGQNASKCYHTDMKRLDRTKTRVTRLGEEDDDSLMKSTTAAERIEMVWDVSITAFEFAGKDASSRLLRHVGNVVRPRG